MIESINSIEQDILLTNVYASEQLSEHIIEQSISITCRETLLQSPLDIMSTNNESNDNIEEIKSNS